MANEFERRTAAFAPTRADIDEGLRAYMLRVYNYMAGGLAITGLLALFVSMQPALVEAIYGTPLRWVVMLAPLGFLFFWRFRFNTMSLGTAQITYWLFAAVMGVSISWIFLVYTATSITETFFITAATFAGMSLYGYTTKRDISNWGSFLMMGLIGIIIAMVVNLFIGSAMINFVVSVLGVLIFVGLTAYDTQQIKHTYDERLGDVLTGKLAINGAIRLYLDFLNLFLFLLHLFGSQR